jgi:transcription antitermination factor NusG
MGINQTFFMTSKKWLLLHTKPNKEDFLYSEITARALECFYPRLWVKPANPRARKIKPFFPGYLFVFTDPTCTQAAELRWLPGSTGWVHFGSELAEVPESVINGIRHHVEQLSLNRARRAGSTFRSGERVGITEGPFSGWEGIFHSQLSGSDRVKVLLRIIHAQQKLVELPASLLRAKNQSWPEAR